MYEEHEADLLDAVYKDLRKPKYEAKLVEIEVLKTDVQTMIKHCREWAKPQRVRRIHLQQRIGARHCLSTGATNAPVFSIFIFQGHAKVGRKSLLSWRKETTVS